MVSNPAIDQMLSPACFNSSLRPSRTTCFTATAWERWLPGSRSLRCAHSHKHPHFASETTTTPNVSSYHAGFKYPITIT